MLHEQTIKMLKHSEVHASKQASKKFDCTRVHELDWYLDIDNDCDEQSKILIVMMITTNNENFDHGDANEQSINSIATML